MLELSLETKHALVCGSTQGIGLAVAYELAELGANIILAARNKERLEEVKDDLPNNGHQKHQYICVDFSDAAAVKEAVGKFVSNQPIVHVLVNNTGGPAPGPIAAAEVGEFSKAFEQHLLCNQMITQALLPGMKEARYGRIINIISTSIKVPIQGLGVSNTIRAAVANWAKTLSVEVAPYGITVNNVLPGATSTQRLDSLIQNRANKMNRSIEEVEEEMKAEIPAGRFADPEELAYAVAFLASPSAGYITGINLPVDGGRTGCL